MFDENDMSESDIEKMEAEGGKFVAGLVFEEQEPAIRNDLHQKKVKTTIVKAEPEPVQLLESEKVDLDLKFLERLVGMAKIVKTNAKRKEKSLKINKNSLDLRKKDQFKQYLEAAENIENYHEKLKYIFEENRINTPEEGFTLTEMAIAWIEFFGLEDSVTLREMKARLRSYRWRANHEFEMNIHPTRMRKGIIRYHILTRSKDGKNQTDVLQDFEDQIKEAKDQRAEYTEELEKKEYQAKEQEVFVTSEGSSTTTAEEEQTEATDNDAANAAEDSPSEEGDQ